tara:strand:- start:84 stop:872 length:789 start_codon:yes stop_codon:yes gene_type:complete
MINAVIAFKKAVANIGFKKAIAEIKFGDFLIFRFFFDVLGITDTPAKSVGKKASDTSFTTDVVSLDLETSQGDSVGFSDAIDAFAIGKTIQDASSVGESIFIETGFNRGHSDTFSAADSISFGSEKRLTDVLGATDSESFQFGKGLADSSAMTDAAALAQNKTLSDSSVTSDNQNMDFHKFIDEVTGVTDDLDGEATANDDQEMTFIKVKSESAAVSDLFTHFTGRALSDTIGSSDSGSLRGQGYCAFDYFEADYVGYSQSF